MSLGLSPAFAAGGGALVDPLEGAGAGLSSPSSFFGRPSYNNPPRDERNGKGSDETTTGTVLLSKQRRPCKAHSYPDTARVSADNSRPNINLSTNNNDTIPRLQQLSEISTTSILVTGLALGGGCVAGASSAEFVAEFSAESGAEFGAVPSLVGTASAVSQDDLITFKAAILQDAGQPDVVEVLDVALSRTPRGQASFATGPSNNCSTYRCLSSPCNFSSAYSSNFRCRNLYCLGNCRCPEIEKLGLDACSIPSRKRRQFLFHPSFLELCGPRALQASSLSSFYPSTACSETGLLKFFTLISFRIATWNTTALLGASSGSRSVVARRFKYLRIMLVGNGVCFLQETHGNESDLLDLRRKFPMFLLFGCFCPQSSMGGVITCVRKSILGEQFVSIDSYSLDVGRVLHTHIIFQYGSLHLVNCHLIWSHSISSRRVLFRKIASVCPTCADGNLFFGGDFNFVLEDEFRLNVKDGSFSSGDASMAKFFNSFFGGLNELHQDDYTRCARDVDGRVTQLSRIDRILCNIPTLYLVRLHPVGGVITPVVSRFLPSDHTLLTIRLSKFDLHGSSFSDGGFRSVPSWVSKHPSFLKHFEEIYLSMNPRRPDCPFEELRDAKECFREAAMKVSREKKKDDDLNAEQNMYFACKCLSGVVSCNPTLVSTSIASWSHLRSFFHGLACIDPDGLSSLVSACSRESINDKTLEVQNDPCRAAAFKKAANDKSFRGLRTWASVNPRISVQGIRLEDGALCASDGEAALELHRSWSEKGVAKGTCKQAKKFFLALTPRIAFEVCWILCFEAFCAVFLSKGDSSPGHDGIPFSCYSCGGQFALLALFGGYKAITNGTSIPSDFYQSLLVFIPKGEEDSDFVCVVRKAADLRPIALSNTDAKIIASCLERPLSFAVRQLVGHHQRGGVRGRGVVDNVIDLEAAALSFSCFPGSPGLIGTDFSNAFPSVEHDWLWDVLRAIGVPEFFVCIFIALYTNLWMQVVFAGEKWSWFLVTRGVKQGGLDSGSLFSLAIEPLMLMILASFDGAVVVPRAFADDVGTAFRNLQRDLHAFLVIFLLFSKASGLSLNVVKCVAVPLYPTNLKDFKTALASFSVLASAFAVYFALKYLGTFLGPGYLDMSWKAQSLKIKSRTHTLKKLGFGLGGDIKIYHERILPVCSHLAQFVVPSKLILSAEDYCLRMLTVSPFTAYDPGLVRRLKDLGLPMEASSLRETCLAARARVASSSLAFFSALQLLEGTDLKSETNLLSLGRGPLAPLMVKWRDSSIIASLDLALKQVEKTTKLGSIVSLPRKGVQSKIRLALRALPAPVSVQILLLRRIRYFLPSASESAGSLAILRFRAASAVVPSRCVLAVLRFIVNGWNTISRMEHKFAPCVFGCHCDPGGSSVSSSSSSSSESSLGHWFGFPSSLSDSSSSSLSSSAAPFVPVGGDRGLCRDTLKHYCVCPRFRKGIEEAIGAITPDLFWSPEAACLQEVVDTFSQEGFFFFFVVWDVVWTTYSDLYHNKSCNFRTAIQSRLRALARDHFSVAKLIPKFLGKGPCAFLL